MVKTLKKLLKELKKYDKIVVTGPQRSGTTIAMEIIAKELNYIPVREEEFETDNLHIFFKILENNKIVIQAPALSYIVGELKNVAVVFMYRNLEEISKSEDKINWKENFGVYESMKYFRNTKFSAHLKIEMWEIIQKPKLGENSFNFNYKDLSKHSLFLENREHFTNSRQTS